MSLRDRWLSKEPFFGPKCLESNMLADEEQIEKQECPNWRCRGNASGRCVYHTKQFSICGDKGMVNDPFFTCD